MFAWIRRRWIEYRLRNDWLYQSVSEDGRARLRLEHGI